MAADYQRSKSTQTANYPVLANAASGLLTRVEPALTPAKFRSRFLKGVEQLFARFGIEYSDSDIKDRLMLATNEVEAMLNTPVDPVQFKEKLPLDRSLYRSFVFLRTAQGPISSVERLAIVTSDNQNVFEVPPEWIETANAHNRQINVVPLLGAYGVNSVGGATSNAGVVFMALMDGTNWIPAYWEITYTAGMCKTAGNVPVVVNSLIGVVAAIDMLSSASPMNVENSVALSQDGISQSRSNPGVQIFQTRIADLEKRKAELLGQIKRIFAKKAFMSNI
jgi:hypothetical protein